MTTSNKIKGNEIYVSYLMRFFNHYLMSVETFLATLIFLKFGWFPVTQFTGISEQLIEIPTSIYSLPSSENFTIALRASTQYRYRILLKIVLKNNERFFLSFWPPLFTPQIAWEKDSFFPRYFQFCPILPLTIIAKLGVFVE